MRRSQSILLSAALGAALLSGVPAASYAADVPNVTVIGTATEHLRAPGKMALDSKGVLYVADAQNRGIVKFDASGRYLGTVPVPGVVRSVALTAADRIMVSHDAQVDILDAAGAPLRTLTGYPFQSPNGIATDPAGNIYVADSKGNRVAVFNAAGGFVSAFGTKGSGQGQLNFPTGIAYESASQQLAVADTMNNRIQFFDLSGAFKRVVGTPSQLAGPLRFTYPQGIAFDYINGTRMYVADAFQSSVQVIDLGALPRFLSYIGSYGTADGQLQHPSDVIYDAANAELLVADSTGRINVYGIGEAQAAGAGASGSGAGTAGSSAGSTSGGNAAGSASGGAGTTTGGSAPGTAGATGNATWQYPAGVDCRHARVGSIVCR